MGAMCICMYVDEFGCVHVYSVLQCLCLCARVCVLGAPGHTRSDEAPHPLQPLPRLARDSTLVFGVIVHWTPGRVEDAETQHLTLSLPPVGAEYAPAQCRRCAPPGERGNGVCVQPADSSYLLFYRECYCIQLCSLGSPGFLISLNTFKIEMCF